MPDAVQGFAAWLKLPGNTQKLVAAVCGVAPSLVSAWRSGDLQPAEYLRPALFILTGIRAQAWRTAEQKRRASAAKQRARAQGSSGGTDATTSR